jgi:hypothetical protein
MNDVIQKEIDSDEIVLETIEDYYNMLKTTMESMESDVLKTSKGNKTASVRLRKSLRFLKKHTGDFVKFTLAK